MALIEERGGYKIVQLSDDHLDESTNVLSTAFANRDPIASSGGWTPERCRPFCEYCIKIGIREKISYCIIEKQTNHIVHVLVSFDYTTPLEFEWTGIEITEYQQTCGLVIAGLGENFRKEYPDVKPKEVLHLWMAGTLDGYEGRGFFIWSSRVLVEQAKKQGWNKIVVEATHEGTHHVLVRKLDFIVDTTIVPAQKYEILEKMGAAKCTFLIGNLSTPKEEG
ncbi:hypothetical protein AKO1_010926 [Acrasis kona]|uniref:Calcineurin-like phosphoesterase domain-containing protein n=1 Tax=Acrasis kona TaxID=1008807 RepID=A0AAW2YRM1_9EUKA